MSPLSLTLRRALHAGISMLCLSLGSGAYARPRYGPKVEAFEAAAQPVIERNKPNEIRQVTQAGERLLATLFADSESSIVDRAVMLNDLGYLYIISRDYPRAESILVQAIELDNRSLAPNDPERAFPHYNLATCLSRQGRFEVAEASYDTAIRIRELAYGPRHPLVADFLFDLAAQFQMQGRFGEAESVFTRVLEIRRKQWGPKSPGVGTILVRLGAIAHNRDELENAEARYRGALDCFEKSRPLWELSIADARSSLAGVLIDLDEGHAADSLLALADPVFDRLDGKQSRRVCLLLAARGRAALGMGQATRAESLFTAALVIGTALTVVESTLVASVHEDLAQAQLQIGKPVEAEAHLRTAAQIFSRSVQDDARWKGPNLEERGWAAFVQEDFGRADSLFKAALAEFDRTGDLVKPRALGALRGIAKSKAEQGLFAPAESLLDAALGITVMNEGKSGGHLADVFRGYGRIAELRGSTAKAESLYLMAWSVAVSKHGFGTREGTGATEEIGRHYMELGNLGQAETWLLGAMIARVEIDGPQAIATAIDGVMLGRVYSRRGNLALADTLASRSLLTLGQARSQAPSAYFDCLSLVAEICADEGRMRAADSLQRVVLKLAQGSWGPQSRQYGEALAYHGKLLLRAGKPDSARVQLTQAAKIARAIGLRMKPLLANIYQELASLSGTASSADSSIELLWKARALVPEGYLGPEVSRAQVVGDLALRLASKRKWRDAASMAQEALRGEEDEGRRALAGGARSTRLAYVKARQGRVETLIDLLLSEPTGSPTFRRAGELALVRWKSRAIDGFVDESQFASRIKVDEGIRDSVAIYQSMMSEIFLAERGGVGRRSSQGLLMELQAKSEMIEAVMATAKSIASDSSVTVSLEAIEAKLPTSSALVEFFRFPGKIPSESKACWQGTRRYVALVITKGFEPKLVTLGPADSVDSLVGRVREGAQRRGNLLPPPEMMVADSIIIEPVLRLLVDTRRIILSPDAALGQMPFAALCDAHGQYLIERYELTMLTSGRDLLRIGLARPSAGRALVLGDPDYSADPLPKAHNQRQKMLGDERLPARYGLAFERNPAWAQEARDIASLIGNADVETGRRASEETLRRAKAPRILHISSHGYFMMDIDEAPVPADSRAGSEDSPSPDASAVGAKDPLLRSGIALAGANIAAKGIRDGVLTGMEASELDLHGTQLVVLAACETGRGEASAGEGVRGLVSALKIAGAESEVLSLWKVDDEATALLLKSFYRALVRGVGRGAALRLAQLELLRSKVRDNDLASGGPARRFADPYYWAGFVEWGDWTPLQN